MKTVKINDFDWAGFRRGDFCIVSDSSQNLLAVLQALSEKGYYWGISGKSLIEDSVTKDQLLDDIEQELIYIRAGGVLENGVLREYSCKGYEVIIDFEEDKNMKEIKRVKAKDFDALAFKLKKFRIAIPDKQSVPRILKFLHEKGFKWGFSKTSLLEDARMRELLSDVARRRTIFIESGGFISNGVTYDTIPSSNKTIIELVFEETRNDKIVITNDGKTTTATLYSNDKKACIGTAVCHDDDKFDIYAGAKLALDRLEKNKKEAEMSDWEKFVKGYTRLRIPKKYIRSFLERAAKDNLRIWGTMDDWCLRCLETDGNDIIVFVDHISKNHIILADGLLVDRSRTVDYFPGIK